MEQMEHSILQKNFVLAQRMKFLNHVSEAIFISFKEHGIIISYPSCSKLLPPFFQCPCRFYFPTSFLEFHSEVEKGKSALYYATILTWKFNISNN